MFKKLRLSAPKSGPAPVCAPLGIACASDCSSQKRASRVHFTVLNDHHMLVQVAPRCRWLGLGRGRCLFVTPFNLWWRRIVLSMLRYFFSGSVDESMTRRGETRDGGDSDRVLISNLSAVVRLSKKRNRYYSYSFTTSCSLSCQKPKYKALKLAHDKL